MNNKRDIYPQKKGKCHFCGEYKQLCKAHIMAKSTIRPNKNIPHLVGRLLGKNIQNIKIPQSGYWDSNILCAECDRQLGVYDEYIKKFFKRDFSKYKPIIPINTKDIISYTIPNTEYDYSKIKKSLICSLWRASISELNICKYIDLGIYNDACKNYLQNKIADIPEVEIIGIAKMIDHPNDAADEIIIYPYKIRICNITAYTITMLGYCIDLKVSKQIINTFRDEKLTEKQLVISEINWRVCMPLKV